MIQNKTFFTIAQDNHSLQPTFQDKSGLGFQGAILPLAKSLRLTKKCIVTSLFTYIFLRNDQTLAIALGRPTMHRQET